MNLEQDGDVAIRASVRRAFGILPDTPWLVAPDHSSELQPHRYLTLSLVSAFLLELLDVTDAGAAVNYGLDRVRFISPVPAGARLRGRAEVVAAEAVTGGVQITSRFTLEIDTGDRPAAVADVLTRFRR